MSDGSLSQEEIDALLQGVDEMATEPAAAPAAAAATGDLTEEERNTFMDILRSELSSAANTLSTIISKKVEIINPTLEIKSPDKTRDDIAGENIQVKIDCTEGITGETLFVLKKGDASVIADLMMGQDGTSPPAELNELYMSAISEAVSQMFGSGLNVISAKVNRQIKVAPPSAEVMTSSNELMLPPGDKIVVTTSTLSIEGLVSSNLVHIFSFPLVKEIVSAASVGTVSYTQPQAQAAVTPMAQPAGPTSTQVSVQQVQFPALGQGVPGVSQEQVTNISLLLDVPMQLTVELGRTKMLVKEILGLGEGSIIELDKLAGEPVDLLVNNKLVAKGEVVVIDENFGVRVTDIINPMERLAGLQQK
ncbi:MAG: flagellar motor switch protein FliN [Spirochaetes bacterium]|nr:flagellar motor switch protein FliN [Spirochaetota bacterium]